jgi:hypothetical protein
MCILFCLWKLGIPRKDRLIMWTNLTITSGDPIAVWAKRYMN